MCHTTQIRLAGGSTEDITLPDRFVYQAGSDEIHVRCSGDFPLYDVHGACGCATFYNRVFQAPAFLVHFLNYPAVKRLHFWWWPLYRFEGKMPQTWIRLTEFLLLNLDGKLEPEREYLIVRDKPQRKESSNALVCERFDNRMQLLLRADQLELRGDPLHEIIRSELAQAPASISVIVDYLQRRVIHLSSTLTEAVPAQKANSGSG